MSATAPNGAINPVLTRRTVLSGAALGALASDARAGTSTQAGSALQEPQAGAVSVGQFGAVGDGQFTPLSSRFATLAAARDMYPTASDLSQSLDGAAIQTAIDHAARLGAALQIRWAVHLPAGRYRLSQSLRLPGNVLLAGDGIAASVIDNQNTPLDAPLIVNADPNVASMFVQDLSLHGGTHGIRIDVRDYVDDYDFTRVSFQMQSDKNFECNKLLQVGAFTGCVFAKAPYGLFVSNWTTNIANLFNCRFEDHSRTSVHLNEAECVNFFGGRFESGGNARGDEATLDLTHTAAVNFHGVYFEGTHPVLLRERRSRNGVTFSGCHFTGSANPGGPPGPYRFDSDGIVNFGPNDWGTPSPGPARMALHGANYGLTGAGRRYHVRSSGSWHIASEHVRLARAEAHRILLFRRTSGGGAADASACITGTLEVTYLARRTDGSPHVVSASFRLRALSPAGGRPIAVVLDHSDTAAPAPFSFTVDAKADQTAITLHAVDAGAGTLQWTVRADATAGDPALQMELDLD